MTKAETLRALADRVEKASGPVRDLDGAIQRAMGPDHPVHFSGAGVCNAYTASLNAAMTLVPEGYDCAVNRVKGLSRANVWMTDAGIMPKHTDAATPALALTAAALRARAAMDEIHD